MSRIAALATALALLLLPATALARFDDDDALHACKQEARAKYGATGFRDLTANLKGQGSYKVMGTMSRRGVADAVMRCRVENGRITELSLKDDGGGVTGAAVGAAIGIAIGAAILGAISDDHKHEDHSVSSGDWSWGGSRENYSPEREITCYPRQQACYHSSGRFAPRWTDREFGGQAVQQPAAAGIRERDMAAFCRGEASSRFHQRPQAILTLPVERDRGQYVVYGQYPPQGGYVTTFRCTFDAAGRFTGISRT